MVGVGISGGQMVDAVDIIVTQILQHAPPVLLPVATVDKYHLAGWSDN